MNRLLWIATLLATGCVATSPGAADAARRGRADAERDLSMWRPRVAVIGVLFGDMSPLDPATGLTKFSAGCCKTPEFLAYSDAYNDTIDAARGAGRLVGMTLEKKAMTREAVAAAFAAGSAAEIRLGGPGVDAPGGRFHLEVAPGTGLSSIALWSSDRATGERSELRYLGSERAQAIFDADGSTLYVRDAAARMFVTFDLPGALLLQVFPDPERAR